MPSGIGIDEIVHSCMNLYATATFLTFLCTCLLALFVLVKSSGRQVPRLFAIYTLAISAWSLCWFKFVSAEHAEDSLFWCRFLHIPASLIPATFLHFAQRLFLIENQPAQKILRWLCYGMGMLFVAMSFLPGFVLSVVPKQGFRFYLEPGPLYTVFFIFFVISIFVIHYVLFKNYQTSQGFKKTQIGLVFVADIMAYTGGLSVFLPVYNLPLSPWTLYLIPLSHGLIAYTILAHRFLDIQIVIRRTLFYSIVSSILAAIYVGLMMLLARILESYAGPLGSVSAFSSVFAAIVITLLFNPLRMRTQYWLDRHFPRERLDQDLLQEAAGGFAHEMKRPLSKIAFPAELLLRDAERVKAGEKTWEEFLPSLEERLQFIIRQSVDAGYLIEAIRELSIASATPFEPVTLFHVIQTALRTENDLLQKHGVSVQVRVPENLPAVAGHAKQLEIVFINLIKNAAEAMGELPVGKPRKLAIVSVASEGVVHVKVVDSGPGLRDPESEKIFQAHYSTKGAFGTGMGLYLSKQIISAHRGNITVESHPDTGTTFTLQLHELRTPRSRS